MKRYAATLKGMKAPLFAASLVFMLTVVCSVPLSMLSAFVDYEKHGVAYSDAQGTLWRGEFSDLSVRGIPLGDVSFRLSPFSFLRAAPSAYFTAQGGAIDGAGRVRIGPGRKLTLGDVGADIRLGLVAPRGVFGEPARGVAKVDIDRIVFSASKGCREAQGELWTDVLDAPARRFNLPAMPMSGGVGCEDGRLVVMLDGANPHAEVKVVLRVDKSFAYDITATARPDAEDVAATLRGFGFEDDNGALIYGSAGVFRGAGS